MSLPLVLRLLGPVRASGTERPLTSQQLAFVTYLACVGPASRQTLIEALWAGQPISDGRFANVVSGVRRAVGRRHLPTLDAERYRLVDVSTDLDELIDLVGPRGPAAPEPPDRPLATLQAAVDLIRGPAFTTPVDRCWWWLDSHPEVVARAEAEVGRAASQLVTRLWHLGDLDQAREVCQQILAWYPLDRDLIVALEGLHRAQGRPGAAQRIMLRWRVQMERLTGEDPISSPELVGWRR